MAEPRNWRDRTENGVGSILMPLNNLDRCRSPEMPSAIVRVGARDFLRLDLLAVQLIDFAVYPFKAGFNGVAYKPMWS